MAVPNGYTVALTINTLGVLTNTLGVNTTVYQCPTCRATTLDPNAHDTWHAANVAAISDAKKAGSDAASVASSAKTAADGAVPVANTAKTTAAGAVDTAGQALTVARQASSDAGAASKVAADANQMAGRAMTVATDTDAALHQVDTVAQSAIDVAQAALPATEVTLCPLCRVAVKTVLLRTHLTYHYRRAHGDPVEFPTDFDPTTGDLAAVDPPMTVRKNLG